MYRFLYDYLKPLFGNRLTLLYMDTAFVHVQC